MEIERVNEQVVGAASQTTPAAQTSNEPTQVTGGFDQILRGMLEGKEQVNEEELYNMLVSEELPSDLRATFSEMYQDKLNAGRRADGYSSVEDATNQALEALYEENLITEDDKMSVMSKAFTGAQLDGNLNALYDGRGSADDPTSAVANAEEAIIRALANYEDPESAAAASQAATSTSTTSNATRVTANDGANGFLWKPESDSTGNLVVLLPTEQKGNVLEANIHDSLGQLIEKGVFSGDDHNGNRPHYRFSEPGEAYGEDLLLKVTLASGEQLEYSIPNGAERVD